MTARACRNLVLAAVLLIAGCASSGSTRQNAPEAFSDIAARPTNFGVFGDVGVRPANSGFIADVAPHSANRSPASVTPTSKSSVLDYVPALIAAVQVATRVYGCTDPGANNYNPAANVDNGTCTYSTYGCTDPSANDYDPSANVDNGSCTYTVDGCTDPEANNYNPSANVNNGSCTFTVYGCTDPSADNYDPSANVDNGSCTFTVYGCTDLVPITTILPRMQITEAVLIRWRLHTRLRIHPRIRPPIRRATVLRRLRTPI
jgi:hypothetical protein